MLNGTKNLKIKVQVGSMTTALGRALLSFTCGKSFKGYHDLADYLLDDGARVTSRLITRDTGLFVAPIMKSFEALTRFFSLMFPSAAGLTLCHPCTSPDICFAKPLDLNQPESEVVVHSVPE